MNKRKIFTVILVQFVTWCIVVLYHFFIGLSSLTECVMVFICTGLLVNGVYLFWSIYDLKRRFKEELKLDAEKRIQEDPNNTELRILYGRDNV